MKKKKGSKSSEEERQEFLETNKNTREKVTEKGDKSTEMSVVNSTEMSVANSVEKNTKSARREKKSVDNATVGLRRSARLKSSNIIEKINVLAPTINHGLISINLPENSSITISTNDDDNHSKSLVITATSGVRGSDETVKQAANAQQAPKSTPSKRSVQAGGGSSRSSPSKSKRPKVDNSSKIDDADGHLIIRKDAALSPRCTTFVFTLTNRYNHSITGTRNLW